MGLAPVLGVVLVSAVFIGVLSSTQAYFWVLQASETFTQSLEYAIKGVATAIVIGVLVAPIYLFQQASPGEQTMVLQAIGAIILGYVGLVVLGYIGDHIYQRIARQHEEVTGHAPFENVDTGGDLNDAKVGSDE